MNAPYQLWLQREDEEQAMHSMTGSQLHSPDAALSLYFVLSPRNVETFPMYVGCEVLTSVVVKSTLFWDITPWSPLSVNRRFGETYRLHIQGRKNKFGKKPA
jgi:hypothetical protein